LKKLDNEEFKSDILENAPVIIAYHDLDHSIIWANKAYLKATGLSLQEIEGEKCYSVWGLGKPCQNCPVFTVIETGEPAESELTPENQEHWPENQGYWLSKAAPRKDKNGKIIGVIEVAYDITERKLSEKKLKTIETNVKNTFSVSPSIISLANINTGYFIEVNPKVTQILGYSVEEFISKPYLEFIHPDDRERTIDEVSEQLKGNEIASFENRYLCKDGSYKWIAWDGTAADKNGIVTAIGSDITKRKNVELSLLESEKTFKIAMDATKDGLYDWNLLDNTIYYSPGWKQMLGYNNDELPNDFSIWEHLTEPEDVKRSWDMQQELINKRRDRFELEFKMKHKDGHWIDILSRAKAIFNKDDIAIRIVGTHVDISERKRAEQLLAEEKELLRAVFEQAGGYCMILQPTDNGIPSILDANEAACRIHGYTREEMIGKPVVELDDEEGKRLCIKRTKMILSGKTLNVENNHIRKDGTVFPVEVFANIIRFKNKPPLIVTTEFDISDRREIESDKLQLEKRLIQAQKIESIGNLAGGIAHDFNNVLYPIIGFTQMSMDDLPMEHAVQENLQDILDGAKRARDLVKQILLFSRQKEQVLRPNILKPLIEEALKLLRVSIPANIDIEANLYDGRDYVLCDDTEIHEIIMNLCTNAYHSMEENGGKMIVRLNKQNPSPDLNLPSGEYICLSVGDNGVGIPEEIIDKIFEPYLTTKEIGKGSGLGLSVVHGIVTNYKGNISVESSFGKGSDFNIFLPITTQSRTVEKKRIKDKPLGGTENILFVDDEANIIKLATRVLERIGYTITGKTSCIEALELFTEKPGGFDLVITDMAMPIMTGTEFAKKILKIQPDIPIIICSGFSENVDSKIAKSIGIKEYIKKPILLDDLTSKIRKVLDQSSKG